MESPSARRGNTLVLVTAILVLLVIIATAYISRAQGGRLIAAAQRKAIDRKDRSSVLAGVVADGIANDLFPGLVDRSDPGLAATGVALTATPRLRVPFWSTGSCDLDGDNAADFVSQTIDRYSVDPQGAWDGDAGLYQLFFPYNFAPYATKAWTNWPDSGLEGFLPSGAGSPAG
ncbi:MAG: hypothetical protein GY895_16000, partial [Phycisphaera sp.]|nr:hypothetical protein [Phycisphaera sp.]